MEDGEPDGRLADSQGIVNREKGGRPRDKEWDGPGARLSGGNKRARSSLRGKLKVLQWFNESQNDKSSGENLSWVHDVFTFAGGLCGRARL
jgi:hypothetical protein